MSTHTPETWRYEKSTKTIRSVPGNYWIATMDSWDGMCNNDANGRLISAAPELLAALREVVMDFQTIDSCYPEEPGIELAKAAILKATGEQL